jgi:hypothetical protein
LTFRASHSRLKIDTSRSLRTAVGDVIAQAVARQKTGLGVQYTGAVLQHLVGARLDCVLGKGTVSHNSFSTTAEASGDTGDFRIGDVVIHVAASPNEKLIAGCGRNLHDGLRPILLTLQRWVTAAEVLAENAGLSNRIDIFEIEQFVALNLYELGKFGADGRKTAIENLVDRYNEIVDEFETDPSLKIELRR